MVILSGPSITLIFVYTNDIHILFIYTDAKLVEHWANNSKVMGSIPMYCSQAIFQLVWIHLE